MTELEALREENAILRARLEALEDTIKIQAETIALLGEALDDEAGRAVGKATVPSAN